MWAVVGNDITMAENDYGIKLAIVITGTTFTASDEIKFVLKNRANGSTLLEKTFSNITQNTINLELTEEESAEIKTGTYVYRLDWYQDGTFYCNIIPLALFKVVDVA